MYKFPCRKCGREVTASSVEKAVEYMGICKFCYLKKIDAPLRKRMIEQVCEQCKGTFRSKRQEKFCGPNCRQKNKDDN